MKTNLKRIFIPLIFLFAATTIWAQVTIGSGESPIDGALLDLKNKKVENPLSITDDSNISSTKGFILPRVKLEDKSSLYPLVERANLNSNNNIIHTGLTVYNLHQSPETTTDDNLIFSPGIYTWTGSQWEKHEYSMPHMKSFYMPSVPIPVISPINPINLYEKYKAQFATPQVKSDGAPTSIPYYFRAEDLYYYITDYDKDVFDSLSITTDGILSYTVKTDAVSEYTFVNIVFVPKVLVD